MEFNSTLWSAAVIGAVAFGVGWLLAALRSGRLGAQLEASATAQVVERERRREAETALAAERAQASDLRSQLAVAIERADRARLEIEEQSVFLERSRHELRDTFQALAAKALQGSSEQFLVLAEQRLGTARVQAASELDEKRVAIETLLAPLRETLERLHQKTEALETSRVDAYSRLDAHLSHLLSATSELHEKTSSLATALRGSSQASGRWGEIALHNVAELAGMTEHCDFEEQVGQAEGGRPDMIVHLPGGGRIAVDAKAPLSAYDDAVRATGEVERKAFLVQHARNLRLHIKMLAERNYPAQMASGFDFVVLFLPGDPFLSAAFAQDPEIQVHSLRLKVLLATPATLVALLRTVALYWQQRSIVENAETIASVARDLYERTAVFEEHLRHVGNGLAKAIGAYNHAVGSFERKILPMARQLEEMKVSEQSRRQLGLLTQIDEAPRRLED